MAILEVSNVTKRFGGLTALNNIIFKLEKGEILALIGPNGAGKSTLFNLITGFIRADSGVIKFDGKNIRGQKPHTICKMGIARTFQLVRTFAALSVVENVMIGSLFGREHISPVKEASEKAVEILKFMGLEDKAELPAGKLTFADRRKLEVGRTLAANPKIILIDEVFAGLNAVETSEAAKLIELIRSKLGITVFIIEHVMKAIMAISDRIIVIHHGEKIAEGTPEDIGSNQRVIDAYLGRARHRRENQR